MGKTIGFWQICDERAHSARFEKTALAVLRSGQLTAPWRIMGGFWPREGKGVKGVKAVTSRTPPPLTLLPIREVGKGPSGCEGAARSKLGVWGVMLEDSSQWSAMGRGVGRGLAEIGGVERC